MLHSDQGESAQQGAHSAQDGWCVDCGEGYGWWQGVVLDEGHGAKWVCAVCAAIRRVVPPPPGYVVLGIQRDLLSPLNLPRYEKTSDLVRHATEALPYVIAWLCELEMVSFEALGKGSLLVEPRWEEAWRRNNIPTHFLQWVLVKKPLWWSEMGQPEPWAYMESAEFQLFSRIMLEAHGYHQVAMDVQWRSIHSRTKSYWAEFPKRWLGWLPKNHPQRSKWDYAMVLPWNALQYKSITVFDRNEDFEVTFGDKSLAAVDNAVCSALRSMCYQDVSAPRLWDALGLC